MKKIIQHPAFLVFMLLLTTATATAANVKKHLNDYHHRQQQQQQQYQHRRQMSTTTTTSSTTTLSPLTLIETYFHNSNEDEDDDEDETFDTTTAADNGGSKGGGGGGGGSTKKFHNLTFIMIHQNSTNPYQQLFYQPVKQGWKNQCHFSGIANCIYMELPSAAATAAAAAGATTSGNSLCVSELQNLLDQLEMENNTSIDGIAAHCHYDNEIIITTEKDSSSTEDNNNNNDGDYATQDEEEEEGGGVVVVQDDDDEGNVYMDGNAQLLEFASSKGIPIITFGEEDYRHKYNAAAGTKGSSSSSSSGSGSGSQNNKETTTTKTKKKLVHVGTNQRFIGRTMARLLKQLRPSGGSFAIMEPPSSFLSSGATRSPAGTTPPTSTSTNLYVLTIRQRIIGFLGEIEKLNRRRKDHSPFYEIQYKNKYFFDNTAEQDKGYDQLKLMETLAIEYNPTAFVLMSSDVFLPPTENEEEVDEEEEDPFVEETTTSLTKTPWIDFVNTHRHRNITYISTDIAPIQLDYLNRRYVDALVGQMPYEMGTRSVKALLNEYAEMFGIATGTDDEEKEEEEGKKDTQNANRKGASTSTTTTNTKTKQTFVATNLVAYHLIPLELPPLELEPNLIGNWVYVGWTCFAILFTMALCCLGWTMYYQKEPVVQAAQPFFLLMTAGGILLMACTLIPLSLQDDDGIVKTIPTIISNDTSTFRYIINPDEVIPPPEIIIADFFNNTGGSGSMAANEKYNNNNDHEQRIAVCMGIPWFAFTGFTITFSALFSKTWRVNQVFQSNNTPYGRVSVEVKDVLTPFLILLSCNVAILTCWTVLDPLTYIRQYGSATDFWNREFESFGSCTSNNVIPFAVPLGLLNFVVLLNACWQAFRARGIESEFSEATYIGLSVFSMFQAFSTGVPLVILSREDPKIFYLVLTLLITILCIVIMLLIFLPKFIIQHKYSKMTEKEQKKMILQSVRKSSRRDSSGILQSLRSSEVFKYNDSFTNTDTNNNNTNMKKRHHQQRKDAAAAMNNENAHASGAFGMPSGGGGGGGGAGGRGGPEQAVVIKNQQQRQLGNDNYYYDDDYDDAGGEFLVLEPPPPVASVMAPEAKHSNNNNNNNNNERRGGEEKKTESDVSPMYDSILSDSMNDDDQNNNNDNNEDNNDGDDDNDDRNIGNEDTTTTAVTSTSNNNSNTTTAPSTQEDDDNDDVAQQTMSTPTEPELEPETEATERTTTETLSSDPNEEIISA